MAKRKTPSDPLISKKTGKYDPAVAQRRKVKSSRVTKAKMKGAKEVKKVQKKAYYDPWQAEKTRGTLRKADRY